jgi:hypothetical protein
VAGALLGWAILGQSMELSTYAGGAAVMVGQLIVVYCRWREAAAHAGDKDNDGLEDEKAVAAGKARLLAGYRDGGGDLDGETGLALVGPSGGAGATTGGAPWREPLR